MGNYCSSCLGNRRRDDYDEDDESRLLFDDPNNLHYGSFSDQPMNGQDDPLEVQRETEALQRLVARTSDNMVDIFEIAPQEGDVRPRAVLPTQYAFAGQDARAARYQALLSKLSSDDVAHHEHLLPQPLSLGSTASTQVDWVPWEEEVDDNIEMQRGGGGGATRPTVVIKAEAGDALVGTFADAAAALAR